MQPTFVLSDTEAGRAARTVRAGTKRLGKPALIALIDAGQHLACLERHAAAGSIIAQIVVDKARCAALTGGRAAALHEDARIAGAALAAILAAPPRDGGAP